MSTDIVNIKVIHNPFIGKDKLNAITRLTIDYPEDLEVFKMLIEHLGENFKTVSLKELVALYWKLQLNLVNGNKIQEYRARLKEQSLAFES